LIDTEDAVGTVQSATLNVFPQLEVRYSDGYKAAKAIVGFGNLVKTIGAVAGVIIALVALSMSGTLFIGGVLFGGLVWLGLFVSGIVICAQGQLLLATLDSAVNNSPFMDNSQRASIMSLSASPVHSAPSPSPTLVIRPLGGNPESEDGALIAQNQAARCEVVTSPEGAQIEVDGSVVGVSPFTFVLKRIGMSNRVVTVRLSGYKAFEQRYVPDGRPIVINLSLERE
jgi:hypothetical protein